MATINAAQSSGRVTLTGTTVDIVNLVDIETRMSVCNWTGATDLTVTWGANGLTAATPVANAAGTFTVPAGTARAFVFGSHPSPVQVRVLGNGNIYSVERG